MDCHRREVHRGGCVFVNISIQGEVLRILGERKKMNVGVAQNHCIGVTTFDETTFCDNSIRDHSRI
jgi:hypothetical protein